MLGLQLRDEFLGPHMPGTAIALRTNDNKGAAQKAPDQILAITYPTADIQTAVHAISEKQNGRPIVLVGDRGRGKSHIMAVMHHAISAPDIVGGWLKGWGDKLKQTDLKTISISKDFFTISEPVHNNEYPLLWDLLFDRHPKGEFFRGQFVLMKDHYAPPRSLLEKMFESQPLCLILDEFQTWYEGLPDRTNKDGLNPKKLAFNFIQNLSEIAKDRPEILIFVVQAENSRIQNEVFEYWPFSPELVALLEDHILMSQAAQSARDLIRILVQVFKTRGELSPIITPADFFVDGEGEAVQSLIDAIAQQVGQEKLREIAQRNLEAVKATQEHVPNARELISAIWMRSMSPGITQGGTPVSLHLDITRQIVLGDNTFLAELTALIQNSINIHGDEVPDGPLWFGQHENPRSKVRACAKNENLWYPNAVSTAGLTVYPGKGLEHIRKRLNSILNQEINEPPARPIVLGANWKTNPWSEVGEDDRPANWKKPVLLVVPDQISAQEPLEQVLGSWLATHVPKKRNTIRFLLLEKSEQGIYSDAQLIYMARCSFLCSKETWGGDPIYLSLHKGFDRPLPNQNPEYRLPLVVM